MMKLAVVGCGRIGKLHAANIDRNPGTRLAGVFDIHPEAAQEVSAATGAAAFMSFEEVIADVDGVVIASATETHADYIETAVRMGVAVFCEKPIDLNLERVDRCRAAISGSGIPVQIGFNRRFDPGHNAVREAARNGRIGDIHQVVITSRDPGLPPQAYLEESGGILRDMTIHDFDLARFMLADEPVEVSASLSRLVDPKLTGEVGDFDTAMLLLRTEAGRQCCIINSRSAAYGYDQRVEVFGSNGMLISDNQRPYELRRFDASETGCSPPILNFFIERYGDSYMAEINHFVDCIGNGSQPSVGFEDGRAALILAEAAYLSIKEQRIVRIGEIA
ncbi:MAG: inositol 2-dehydrogenase [Rhodobacteraceae bacterium]|nr:inositol 2-dehydrogenase [Paracoccaceae bacterium]